MAPIKVSITHFKEEYLKFDWKWITNSNENPHLWKHFRGGGGGAGKEGKPTIKEITRHLAWEREVGGGQQRMGSEESDVVDTS
jgi:hypothetical protein